MLVSMHTGEKFADNYQQIPGLYFYKFRKIECLTLGGLNRSSYFYRMKHIITLLLLIPVITKAQVNEATLNDNIQSVMPKVIEWRRHFHQNPELSNREYKTGAFVADYLKSLGL